MSAKRADTYAGGAVARYTLLGSAFVLTAFGLLMIYSASSITAAVREGASWHYLARQAVFVTFSGGIAWWLSRVDYRRLQSRAFLLWAVSLGLLMATFLVGVVRGGARRWIDLGILNLQPSELAKIACVLLVSSVAIEWMRGRIETRTLISRTLVFTGLPTLFVILQPDLGTTITLVVAVVLVLILAGLPMRWIAAAAGLVVGLGALMIAIEPFRVTRVLSFLDPWKDPQGSGFQIIQALLAFGTGGVDGVGLGLSRQKFFYLPAAHTDFILAIIGEEVGLVGTLLVVVGIAVFVWAGMRISAGARDPFGRLVAGALTGMLGVQAVLNIAAVTGVLPITGKPLPFVSYGGSSMLVTMICLGLLLSVSQFGALAPRAVRTKSKSEVSNREGSPERWGDRGARASRPVRRGPSSRRA
ncbi:MAG: putative lipid II flippase FtsW [Coriobacteriia bacterium]|nr:putative lipid II flippase FtsW [Coriobacteriia bacterium]